MACSPACDLCRTRWRTSKFFDERKVNDSNAEKTIKKRKLEKEKFLESTELLIMDITPPCDHANKKAVLRKFVSFLKVPAEYEKKGKDNV